MKKATQKKSKGKNKTKKRCLRADVRTQSYKKKTKNKTIYLRNKRYKFIRTKLLPKDCWGICDDPTGVNCKIKIDRNLRGMKELEITVHEMLHACFWDIDEKVIKEVGNDISQALWKFGYRK